MPIASFRFLAPLALTALLAACTASIPSQNLADANNHAPAYVPRPVTVPAQAGYLLPDGRVHIIGNDGM